LFLLIVICTISCGDDTPEVSSDSLQLVSAKIGQISLSTMTKVDVPKGENIILSFNKPINPTSIDDILIEDLLTNNTVPFSFSLIDNDKLIEIIFSNELKEGSEYSLNIPNTLLAADGGTFAGLSYSFEIKKEDLILENIRVDGKTIAQNINNQNISLLPTILLTLSHDIEPQILKDNVVIVGSKNYDFDVNRMSEATYEIKPINAFEDFSKINLLLPSSIGTDSGRIFETKAYKLYTQLDDVPDFPTISDEELLTLIQAQTFKYFYDFAHPNSGLARERNTSGNTVTSGGSGFGLMAMIVAIERGFITRLEAITRWQKIFDFLENADRFHGVWSHWINGDTGKVIPFSAKDNGGDIVETAFLIQGMLTVRQYLNESDPTESAMIAQINKMWEEVEWDWYTQGNQKIITWHWSPNFGFDINLDVRGHNETQIIYTLAAASPTYSIDLETYQNGYARNGGMQNGNTFYGEVLPAGSGRGGPLFFSHYSYLGMDPRNLSDQYVNYWEQNVAHTRINRAYCIDNPNDYVGYSETCWGLTASDNNTGYSAHSPSNDKGVITPTAAISSIPFTPEKSMEAIKHFYYDLGSRLWGEYGFYDAFNPTEGWVASSYLAIDQGPIICMIENHRTGLLWDLYMSAPEVQVGLDKLEISY